MKVSLDDKSLEKLDQLNDNLEALIIQTKENNRICTELLDWYQTMSDKNKQ